MTTAGRVGIFVIDMGRPSEELLQLHGPYSRWFLQAFAVLEQSVEVHTCTAPKAVFDDLAAADGVILTGAEEGVYDELPWRNRFDPMMEKLIDTGKPVLGVCFSHQYLSEILGGRVEHRPDRGENGHITVELTEAGRVDPLFSGIAESAGFLAAHGDMVVEPAPGSVLLAANDRVPVQSFSWGDNVWGVQFHPELTPEISRTIITTEEPSSEDRERLLHCLDRPHSGLKILDNFLSISASARIRGERP